MLKSKSELKHILQCPICTSIRTHALRPKDRPSVYRDCGMVRCEECTFNAWVPIPNYIPDKQVERYLIKQWYAHSGWGFAWSSETLHGT